MVEAVFKVLMVCSGNLCRSPIAEQFLTTRTRGCPVVVSSAGVMARDGAAMPDEAATISLRYGGRPEAHRSRFLTEAQLREVDLVLTATRAHRSSVVRILPRMANRAFTINEFARLLEALPPRGSAAPFDAVSVVDAARSLRGHVSPPENPADDDLEDPYRRPFEVYESVGARLHEQIMLIAEHLYPRGLP